MTIRSSNAFVIKKENIDENDRLYTFYTEDFGKLNLIAKGAQKTKAKLSGHLEIPSYVWIKFSLGQKDRLISALEKEPFLEIKHNFWALEFSFEILKFLDAFTPFYQKDTNLWFLLFETFFYLKENLNRGKFILDFFSLYFKSRVLFFSGWAPYLDGCLFCNQEAHYFSFDQKGLVCKQHRKGEEIFLTKREIEFLKDLFCGDIKNFFKISLIKEILKSKDKFNLILKKFAFSLGFDII
ncbi:MAG: DNA repair protein RecO [Candidatus Paceibacterota bacterium]